MNSMIGIKDLLSEEIKELNLFGEMKEYAYQEVKKGLGIGLKIR